MSWNVNDWEAVPCESAKAYMASRITDANWGPLKPLNPQSPLSPRDTREAP